MSDKDENPGHESHPNRGPGRDMEPVVDALDVAFDERVRNEIEYPSHQREKPSDASYDPSEGGRSSALAEHIPNSENEGKEDESTGDRVQHEPGGQSIADGVLERIKTPGRGGEDLLGQRVVGGNVQEVNEARVNLPP